jgi:fatty-acyl-CoA synthase
MAGQGRRGVAHRHTYATRTGAPESPGAQAARRSRATGVGTLAWNGYRHFELYFGVSGMGV